MGYAHSVTRFEYAVQANLLLRECAELISLFGTNERALMLLQALAQHGLWFAKHRLTNYRGKRAADVIEAALAPFVLA